MLPKWKLILTNWINCYFNNSNIKDLPVNLESLLDIISHLRENLNLDESKSSLLDAHTVQEFILEKYPDFKFDNGTIDPDGEGDVYLVASLLLFFVCVNSKNVDMKSAMCSKLSPEDQEIILKFSKTLMDCCKITITELQAAITEACGQDMAAAEPRSLRMSVAETPPALRSFHSEVRRLQAALDAERFDRTYLQEELTRTNLKVEKLLKDKEQYKLEIVNLKSQISLCCGQEKESQGENLEGNNVSKLVRQLEQTEERLLSAQEQLEDVQKERETYKTKLSQLKSEHDKLLAFCHQESSRASGLAEELEIERRHTQSLRELVAELRQHNHLNKMDSSLVECDDPDASIHSLQHNSSACSEICANVIEVQLGEERAKIVALKQQIQMLQDQLCEITRKSDEEKESLTQIISTNESTIMNLKHRVNEEIEEKNTLKTIFDDDVAKLNNELNELEQRLKGTQENSRHIIENKMHEIQILQEEKLSLLQSLSDETTKCENMIKQLRDEIDAEKSSKIRLRDDYDSHIMKLNEKVLNRNNELVELQNKILEKGETIERLQLDLRKEKELREELSNKYNNELVHLNSIREQVEQDLKHKSEEAKDLHKYLQQHIGFIEQINKDNDQLRANVLQLQGDCQILQDSKDKLLAEVKNRDVKAEQIYKETENFKNLLYEEQQKLRHNMEETNTTINALHARLEKEIQEVSRLKEDLHRKAEQIEKLTEEKRELDKLLTKYKNDITVLKEENNEWKIKKDLAEVEFTNKIVILKKELKDETESRNKLQALLEETQDTVKHLDKRIVDLHKQNSDLELEKHDLITKLEVITTELETNAQMANEECTKITNENKKLLELLDVQKLEIANLESILGHEKQRNNLLQEYNNNEKLNLVKNYNLLQEHYSKAKQEIESKQKEIDLLIVNINELTEKSEKNVKNYNLLQEHHTKAKLEIESKQKEIDLLIENINELTEKSEKFVKNYNLLQEHHTKAKQEIESKQKEIDLLIENNNELTEKSEKIVKNYNLLQEHHTKAKQEIESKQKEIDLLIGNINELTEKSEKNDKNYNLLQEHHTKANQEIESKQKEIDLLIENINELTEKSENNVKKYNLLHEHHLKAKQEIDSKQKEIDSLIVNINELTEKSERNLSDKDTEVDRLLQKNEECKRKLTKEFSEERESWLKECELKADTIKRLTHNLEVITKRETDAVTCLRTENEEVKKSLALKQSHINDLEEIINECKIKQDSSEVEYTDAILKLRKELLDKLQENQVTVKSLNDRIDDLTKQNADLDLEKQILNEKIEEMSTTLNQTTQMANDEYSKLKQDNQQLHELLEVQKSEIERLESLLVDEKQATNNLQQDYRNEKLNFANKCSLLEEYQTKAQQEIEDRQKDIELLNTKVKEFTEKLDSNLRDTDLMIDQLRREKDEQISRLHEQLAEERRIWLKESESKEDTANKLIQKVEEDMRREADAVKILRVENEELKRSLGQRESHIIMLQEKNNEWKVKQDLREAELNNELHKLNKELMDKSEDYNRLESIIQENQLKVKILDDRIADLTKRNDDLEREKNELNTKLEEMNSKFILTTKMASEEQNKIKNENKNLLELLEAQKSEIIKLASLLEQEKEQNTVLQHDNNNEKLNLTNKCSYLQECQVKAHQDLETRQKEVESLTAQVKELIEQSDKIVRDRDMALDQLRQEKDEVISKLDKEFVEEKEKLIKDSEFKADAVNKLTEKLEEVTRSQADTVKLLTKENETLKKSLSIKESYIFTLEEKNDESKIKHDSFKLELTDEILKLKKDLMDKSNDNNKLESMLQENQATIKTLNDHIADVNKQIDDLESEKKELITKLDEMDAKLKVTAQAENEEHSRMKLENQRLLDLMEVQKSEIIKLESLLMYEKQQNNLMQCDNNNEKTSLIHKCSVLQECQSKSQEEIERKHEEIESLNAKLKEFTEQFDTNLRSKDLLMEQLCQEKDTLISKLSGELVEERENLVKESELRADAVNKLAMKLEEVTRSETDTVKLLRKENEILKKSLALKESFAAAAQEVSNCKSASQGADAREHHQQVDTTPTEHTQSSFESSKTISDLEKILQDRYRTIRSLQSDITDLKSLVAESENKLLDVSNELEVSKENCQQLSSQLKKIVHQKNEEIAELKKQLTKMTVTENRASQIIKVSARYQAIILKRIAEIKSNTVLKELTNFGNTTNCDNDLRRGLHARTITMEDLENFLDSTDKHLKRFSEKQLALQKERDRLAEVNRINESEIINMKKFLTELSVGVKTFNSVKELYAQKLSRVVSLQRTVRREILSLDGRVTDAAMCKLERGYAAVMQDLSECAMNMERWVERAIGRVISVEKIKQSFSSEERPSVASTTIQNASLEVQLEELENSFCKLLEEIARAQKGEGAKDAQAVTVMEVRAEYEDKLNRMKTKMKQLYHEQIEIFKEKQRDEVASLERQLQKANEKLEESSQAYEEHIRSLTTELWNVGEKLLMTKDEAEWLRRKQRSGSLMSLQHVHSSGLVPTQEEPSRPSDTHSLRSLPVGTNNNNKNEGRTRTLHMSDEEGEVFDNRCLRELATTPARASAAASRRATRDGRPSAHDVPPPHRLSELQWRNSLCPPHLKSSYPAETQFVSAIHEEDIKCVGGPSMSLGGRTQRKEVGITAYKKPGPPTPSKQAGRLSATDSELRESLRVETEPNASRKTGTPSRIRALFRSAKGDNEGTPRSRRLSNIFRKK